MRFALHVCAEIVADTKAEAYAVVKDFFASSGGSVDSLTFAGVFCSDEEIERYCSEAGRE